MQLGHPTPSPASNIRADRSTGSHLRFRFRVHVVSALRTPNGLQPPEAPGTEVALPWPSWWWPLSVPEVGCLVSAGRGTQGVLRVYFGGLRAVSTPAWYQARSWCALMPAKYADEQ
jgi:hypothetical protein